MKGIGRNFIVKDESISNGTTHLLLILYAIINYSGAKVRDSADTNVSLTEKYVSYLENLAKTHLPAVGGRFMDEW